MHLVNHLGRICYSIIVLLEIKRRIDRNMFEIKVVTKINEENIAASMQRRSQENNDDSNSNIVSGNTIVEDNSDS